MAGYFQNRSPVLLALPLPLQHCPAQLSAQVPASMTMPPARFVILSQLTMRPKSSRSRQKKKEKNEWEEEEGKTEEKKKLRCPPRLLS